METITVNIHQAKTHLSRLLSQLSDGKEVIIAKNGRPLARLVSLIQKKPRQPGRFLGQTPEAGDQILQPLAPEESALWQSGTAEDPLSCRNS